MAKLLIHSIQFSDSLNHILPYTLHQIKQLYNNTLNTVLYCKEINSLPKSTHKVCTQSSSQKGLCCKFHPPGLDHKTLIIQNVHAFRTSMGETHQANRKLCHHAQFHRDPAKCTQSAPRQTGSSATSSPLSSAHSVKPVFAPIVNYRRWYGTYVVLSSHAYSRFAQLPNGRIVLPHRRQWSITQPSPIQV